MLSIADFFRALWLSLIVSGTSTIIGAVIGIPVGLALSEFSFRGKRTALTVIHALMGLPPVVVGVFAFLLIARSAPLGFLGLLYTVAAMVIVQVILATPIIAGLTHAALEEVDPRFGLQAQSLGATRAQAILTKAREVRSGLVAAVIAGFGRVIGEVGAVMIVGGALSHRTDTLTTLAVKLTRQGRYELALLAGVVLLIVAIIINVFLTRLQSDKGRSEIEKRVTGYVD